MFKLRPAPEREPAASVFSIHQTDEEVRDAVIQHYFAPEELVQARHMAEETGSYEEAIRYLVQLGQDSLRDSAEARPPRVYITIPGGRIIIHHPARLGVDNPVLYTFSIAHLACQAFPPPTTRSAPASVPASDPVPLQPLFFDSPPAALTKEVASPVARAHTNGGAKGARAKRGTFVQQPVSLGNKSWSYTREGWVLKHGWLGYVLKPFPEGGASVDLVHLVSHRVMATISLADVDETTHARLQAWVCEVHALTDWSRGIQALLREQAGKQKLRAWSALLEQRWKEQQKTPMQVSFF